MNSLDNAITLQTVHMNIWFSPEPFANISGNASAMLNSLRDAWNDDPYLSTVQRDVVHLLTKRGDTGTGGIAFVFNILGAITLCSNSAYGLSSDLSQSTGAYPNYSWNLNVICHELAHNFGSRHTHWCGWPGDEMLHPNGAQGGAFLVCTEPDEGPDGPCENPVEENVGTIMSYCHNNGSVVLDFHPVVKTYGILPYTSEGTCLTTCDDFVEPCCVLGCTDPSACNFDGDAVVDDGTCSYPEFSYVDCQGNCLEDIDNDGVCDAIDNCVGGCSMNATCVMDQAPFMSVDVLRCHWQTAIAKEISSMPLVSVGEIARKMPMPMAFVMTRMVVLGTTMPAACATDRERFTSVVATICWTITAIATHHIRDLSWMVHGLRSRTLAN